MGWPAGPGVAAAACGTAARFTGHVVRNGGNSSGGGSRFLVRRRLEQSSHILVLRLDRLTPNGIGVVLDDQNHLLIPRFVDKAACRFPIPDRSEMADGPRRRLLLRSQADLTLRQLNTHIKTKPATISGDNPEPGPLLLVMSLNPAANRLAVWEGWEPDVSTLVNIDGYNRGIHEERAFSVGGGVFAGGPGIDGATGCAAGVPRGRCGTRSHRMIRLGSRIRASGRTPALKIDQVVPGEAAERAGLQQDDLILSLAGESVGDPQSFAAAIANLAAEARRYWFFATGRGIS